jgi:beta-N-acetylhexosaminidase
MSLGPVMLDIAGTALTAEERERLRHPLAGGVILFARNYDSPEQIQALVSEIHSLRTPPLLVAVDHEGGRVQRFRTGFTGLPAVARIGEVYDENPKRGRRLAETAGWLMAAELRAVGVDLSFAPVLDVDRGISRVIGDRSFHARPEAVADLAHAYMTGMHRAGMAATGKHFPGHGGVEADSHVAVPVDERAFEDIFMEDILPFQRMIDYGLEGIMPAHVIYPKVDPNPAGFSRFWLQRVLRGELGFEGVVFSDDLSMEGAKVAGGVVARAQAALAAGCDMVLVCNDPTAAGAVLDALDYVDNPASHLRLARMHGRQPISRDQLLADAGYREAVRAVGNLA